METTNKLKTLKDFENLIFITEISNPEKNDLYISFCGQAKINQEACSWEDFCGTGNDKLVGVGVLRKEAIKHIKDLREEEVDCIKYRFANDFAANILKSFFNITKEDLT